MKVSVILPTYNRLPLLKRAINSFFNQDYDNSELIILDNGCTDGTTEYLKQIENFRIKVLYREENNPLGALNMLWNTASGDLICQLHDDDQFTEQGLSSRVRAFEKDKFLEVVYAGWHNVTLQGKYLGAYKGQASNPSRILVNEYINFTTMMWRNELKKKFMFDDELVFQMDSHFKIRCAMECTMTAIEEPVMLYAIHPTQETNRMRREGHLEKENRLLRQKINQLYGGLFL